MSLSISALVSSTWFACLSFHSSSRPIKPRDSPRARRIIEAQSRSRLQIAVSCSIIHCTCAQFVVSDLSLAEDAVAIVTLDSLHLLDQPKKLLQVRVTNLQDASEHIGEVLRRVKKEHLERAYKIS